MVKSTRFKTGISYKIALLLEMLISKCVCIVLWRYDYKVKTKMYLVLIKESSHNNLTRMKHS